VLLPAPRTDLPWSVDRFPNYDLAKTVEVVSSSELTRRRFFAEFVNENRPCLIKGAVRDWPAAARWRSPDYLREKCGAGAIQVRTVPFIQGLGVERRLKELERRRRSREFRLFTDFLDAATSGSEKPVWIGSYPLEGDGALAPLAADVGRFGFLDPVPRAWDKSTPTHRAFVFRGSYTDWHFHLDEEALMSQVVGTKETLLLPPDAETWSRLWPVVEAETYAYEIDTAKFPRVAGLVPYRVRVEPGDALYIPLFWWHAVEAPPGEFGITVSTNFRAPLHVAFDPRLPGARKRAWNVLRTRRAHEVPISILAWLIRVAARGKGLHWMLA
jgi:hypothetical protein